MPMSERGDLSRRSMSVVQHLAGDPDRARYGAEIMRSLNIQSGSLYPMLDRLSRRGWLEAEREDVDPSILGRPARTYYQLTGEGLAAADQLARESLAELRVASPRPSRTAEPQSMPPERRGAEAPPQEMTS